MRTPPGRAPKYGRFGADTRDIRELLQLSSVAAQARSHAAATGARPAADRDDNNIAILEDRDGDLILRANPFDLANTGLRFEPAGGGYAVTTTGAEFRAALGRALTLGDDDSVRADDRAPFEFYGRRFTSLFVNSDGNLTFEEGDNASTERGLGRLASGAPRIAPFFADLDPSAGGRVFFDSAPDATTITWCAVPGFDLPQTMTVQAVLFSNGAIEFRFGASDLTRRHRGAVAGPDRNGHTGRSEPDRRPGDRAGRDRRAVRGLRPRSTSSPPAAGSTRPIPTTSISWCSGPTRR